MRYVVRVNGADVVVELGSDGAIVDGHRVSARLDAVVGTPLGVLTVGEEVHRVIARPAQGEGRGRYTLWIDGFRYEVEALDDRARAIRDLAAKAARTAKVASLVAPMPGLIVRVNVQVGETVEPAQGLIVMEAMKMENELRAAAAGTVTAILVTPGMAVERGATLVELE
ncbi:MAG: hypothetical protein NVS4B3_22850 [Gemmatimonadaceae bacterium]